MSSSPSSPEKRDEVEDLAQAIREAIDDEISELAANLASTDDAHLFGDNEFKIPPLPTRSPRRRSSSTWRKKKLGWQSVFDQRFFKRSQIGHRIAAEATAQRPRTEVVPTVVEMSGGSP